MTTPIGYSVKITRHAEINAYVGQAYRTNKSMAAVHFDLDGKGEIVFLKEGVTLRVTGPSSCLRKGLEILSEKEFYNLFEVDLLARCSPIFEPVKALRRAVAA